MPAESSIKNVDSKPPSASAVQTRQVVMPQHTNPQGNLFGGELVCWIDLCAAMAAVRHCRCPVVTASIDQLSFDEPISLGDQLLLEATVNYAGTTSMEVGVKVSVEHLDSEISTQVTKAYLTFVALDEQRKPTPVPKILPETEKEKRRYTHAKLRVQTRKELIQKLS